MSSERYRHSISVEEMAVKLAQNYGIDEYPCSLADLAHDICREMPLGELQEYSDANMENPLLGHGHAGAVLLKEQFNITNISVLNAVRYHTSGSPVIDNVGKIVFSADFLEPGRSFMSDLERERLLKLDLDGMVLDIAEQIKQYLTEQGKEIDLKMNEMISCLHKEKVSAI